MRDSPPVKPVSLPVTGNFVLSADAAGRKEELADYYRRLLAKAAPAAERSDSAAYGCLEVGVLLMLPEEPHVLVDVFGAAQRGADFLLGELADVAAPTGVAYDDLDQGWALRILVEPDSVVVLQWDWDRPVAGQTVLAVRLARQDVAQQAAEARVRLRRLHGFLKDSLGVDLWNLPGR